MCAPTTMTFLRTFWKANILSGKKTITIRDESERDYQNRSSVVEVSTLGKGRVFCNLRIISVEPILF